RWYDVDGRERQKTYKGVAREEALKLERELLAARDRGEQVIDERKAPLFKPFAEQWVEESRSGWKPSTRQQYDQVLKSQLLPIFAEMRVTQVTESRVRQAITSWQDAGLSARRTNLVMLVLKMIMKTARRRRWLRDDPLATVKMLREPQVEIDPLSPDEVDVFL